MIQVDEKDLQAVLDIAQRAPKSVAEERLMSIIVDRWNHTLPMQTEQSQQAEKREMPKPHRG